MRLKPAVCLTALILVLLSTTAGADQIVLKDGTVYSGKFIRGDSNVVEFRVLGRVESFKIPDISRIVFKEPELEQAAPNAGRAQPAQPARPGRSAQTAQPAGPASQAAAAAPAAPLPEAEPDPVDESPAPEPQPARAQAKAPTAGQLAPGSAVTLPVGTGVMIRTSTEIDTERNRVGDIFEATLDQDVAYGDQTIFPRGTPVKGRIAYAREQGKLTGKSQLILELMELTANGKTYILRTTDYSEEGANRSRRTAATVGGGAALGAVIGAIAGGGTGAAVGAASGAAVGTGVQVLTKGEVLRIPVETILEFRLQSPLEVQVP